MKRTTFFGVLAAPVLLFAVALPTYADSTCKDGTTSTATGKGTCSGHGGVQKAAASAATPATPAPAASAASPAPTVAPTSAAQPAGATAKCKDGTFSTSKSHSGACSKHGGVSDFLPPAK